jgi:hypothetical protein
MVTNVSEEPEGGDGKVLKIAVTHLPNFTVSETSVKVCYQWIVAWIIMSLESYQISFVTYNWNQHHHTGNLTEHI